MSALSQTLLPPVSRSRRVKDRVMRGLLLALTLLALVPLVLIIYYLLKEGLSAVNSSLFTTDPDYSTGFTIGATEGVGGIRSALVGSVVIVVISTAISVPLGIGVGLYLTEYGKNSWLANTVRYFVDVMTGVPSVIFGLFIYITLILTHVAGNEAGWKASLAIALLMLPIIARSAEVVLLLVPNSLREAALALGAPRWRVIRRVVLPTALPGLVTGILLAVARGLGETAPILFTAGNGLNTTLNPGAVTTGLPLVIYNDITGPNSSAKGATAQGWAAALTLVVLILILNLIARLASRRSRV